METINEEEEEETAVYSLQLLFSIQDVASSVVLTFAALLLVTTFILAFVALYYNHTHSSESAYQQLSNQDSLGSENNAQAFDPVAENAKVHSNSYCQC
jgi:hypothetical protein